MSIFGVNDMLAAYQYAASKDVNKTDTNGTNFIDQLQKTGTSKVDVYTEYLKQRYGVSVSVQNVGKDQSSIDRIGAGTAGTGNVVIASNILEQMANDPEKAAYYEKKIQDYFNSVPRCQAELSAMGHEIHSSGIVIHPDGTVTHYISGDLKPEVRAKIEAKVRAEQAAKRKRHQRYQKLGEEAAAKHREQTELQYHKQLMEDALKKSNLDTIVNYHFISRSQVSAAAMAYESAIGAYSSGVLGNT